MTQPNPTSVLATSRNSNNLFASIDMGTNSCKLLIIQVDQSSRKFLTVDRHKHPVSSLSSSSSSFSLHNSPHLRALQHFAKILAANDMPLIRNTRCVATAAIREASNQLDFVNSVKESTGLAVEVLSGEQEARLVYLGVLQFLPVFDKRVLVIDIGGGSTEFVVGIGGKVTVAVSLKLGHVVLSQKFVRDDGKYIVAGIREFVKSVISESELVEKVKGCHFELVVGSSGTARAVEKAIFHCYGSEPRKGNEGLVRKWKFSKGELKGLLEKLVSGVGEREGFFGKRSEFIVAGVVLLEEIFEAVGIVEMEVSEYGLGEGVVAERLAEVSEGFGWNPSARWQDVVRATRLSGKKGIKCGAQCATVSKVIFDGLRKRGEMAEKDLECLEAACLLHNIGLINGKKGYHKQSYSIIMNGNHLCGYSAEEVKLIALLTRHHRKKFPRIDHSSLKGIPEKSKQKFRALCAIIRISVVLQQNGCLNFHQMECLNSSQGPKLVFREARKQLDLTASVDFEMELTKELEQFMKIFHESLSVEILTET